MSKRSKKVRRRKIRKCSNLTAKKRGRSMSRRVRRKRKMKGGSVMNILNKALVPIVLFTGNKYLQKRKKGAKSKTRKRKGRKV
tara:strand:+ start:444 stop:692 length:249 start_codon:yes stop_codon:yes gene_type:complete